MITADQFLRSLQSREHCAERLPHVLVLCPGLCRNGSSRTAGYAVNWVGVCTSRANTSYGQRQPANKGNADNVSLFSHVYSAGVKELPCSPAAHLCAAGCAWVSFDFTILECFCVSCSAACMAAATKPLPVRFGMHHLTAVPLGVLQRTHCSCQGHNHRCRVHQGCVQLRRSSGQSSVLCFALGVVLGSLGLAALDLLGGGGVEPGYAV